MALQPSQSSNSIQSRLTVEQQLQQIQQQALQQQQQQLQQLQMQAQSQVAVTSSTTANIHGTTTQNVQILTTGIITSAGHQNIQPHIKSLAPNIQPLRISSPPVKQIITPQQQGYRQIRPNSGAIMQNKSFISQYQPMISQVGMQQLQQNLAVNNQKKSSGMRSPPNSQGQMPIEKQQMQQNTPQPSSSQDKGSGDNLAGQTITVEAVECTPIPGQSRRLIKLVVSGARGQAHNILSKNQQLQQQILNMMTKAKTSTAEVSFPSDPEQPIRVTCKSNVDTNVTAAGDSTKKPVILPMSQGGNSPLVTNNQPNMGKINSTPNTMPTHAAVSPKSHLGNLVVMTPGQIRMRSPLPQSSQLIGQNAMRVGLAKVAKRLQTPEQYVRNILQNESNPNKLKEKNPVGVATQYQQQHLNMFQPQQVRPQAPMIQQRRPDGLLAPSAPQFTVKDSGQLKGSQNFIAGNDYTMECPNGNRIVGTWDGRYFKVKNPEVSGMAFKGQRIPGTESHVNPSITPVKQVAPKITYIQTMTNSDGNLVSVARSEPQPQTSNAETAGNTPQSETRKRSIPKQEGKYAVCDNCGNLSSDYDTCEGCKRPLPEEPKLFAPNAGGTQLILVPNSGGIPGQQFYAKATNQAPMQKGVAISQARGRGRIVVRGRNGKSPRGRGKGRGNSSHELDTVTILSSEDEEGDEMRVPGSKALRLEKGLILSKKMKMEDESGKIVMKPGIKKLAAIQSPNISASKVTEQKNGGNTVIRMVDPVIKLAAQAVRIGSMQTVPINGAVEFSLKGFRMMLRLPADIAPNKVIDVRVDAKEIMEIQACYQKFMVLFINVHVNCAVRIRNRCGMENASEHYFDPSSMLECHKHLTVLMSQWGTRDQEIFKAVCRKMETDKMCGAPRILSSLDPDTANELLIQASYVGPPVKKKTAVPAGQVVTQISSSGVVTTTSLVPSGLLINQSGIMVQIPGQSMAMLLSAQQKFRPPSVDGDEEEEPVDRSRSPSPILPSFAGPLVRLFTYPPAPITGGIPVTNEDLFCLNEGEFLNDVIIDFYLKYLVNEMLSDEDKDRTHVFSSFFYRRLTQKQNKRQQDDQQNMSASEKRHARVKTWTRHVDLFDKDFVIVPINESAHWYLAVICFPGLSEPIIEEEPITPLSHDATASKDGSEDPVKAEEDNNSNPQEGPSQSDNTKSKPEQPPPDKSNTMIRRTVLQPTILIFDSLCGPGRTTVARTLREYIQVEWNIKKAESDGTRIFTKDNMRGCIPKCPQQTNFSDCGIFVLQYVESFFKNPIQDYSSQPMDLLNWFPDSHVRKKREELRLLILDLQQELNSELDYDPTQDGCIGTSPSHMVTIPMSMDSSLLQPPVIMSAPVNANVQHHDGQMPTSSTQIPSAHLGSEQLTEAGEDVANQISPAGLSQNEDPLEGNSLENYQQNNMGQTAECTEMDDGNLTEQIADASQNSMFNEQQYEESNEHYDNAVDNNEQGIEPSMPAEEHGEEQCMEGLEYNQEVNCEQNIEAGLTQSETYNENQSETDLGNNTSES